MKAIFVGLMTVSLAASAFAKGKGMDKETMDQKMVTACKAELAKDPVLADTTDGEVVWKNLEDKEHSQVKMSKNCHRNHENYEQKFHKGEENEATEKQ